MFNTMYINKDNLIYNYNILKKDNLNAKICAMVKANAYGLGLKQIVKVLSPVVNFFGVSNVNEALAVRKLCDNKILVVTPLDINFIKKVISSNKIKVGSSKTKQGNNIKTKLDKLNISFTCADIDEVKFLAKLNITFNIHLKINTGMNRFGFSNLDDFKKALEIISNSKLNLEGVFTHFATSDNYVEYQFNKFKPFISTAKQIGFNPIIHADNSSNYNKHHLDMIRVGFNFYNNNFKFKPVAQIESTVLQINSVQAGELVGYDYRCVSKYYTRVAVLSLGYADGFSLKYLGYKLNINGVDCKVLNICMDCVMIDIKNLDIKKGDKVFILNNLNPLNKYSDYCNISSYEIMTGFSHLRGNRKLISSSRNKHKKN